MLPYIAGQCDEEAGHTRFTAMNYLPEDDAANTRSDEPDIVTCERDEKGIANMNFKVLPNPAADWVSIMISTKFSGEIQIMDATGKIIHQVTLSEQNIAYFNTQALSAGIYFCVAQSSSGERKTTSFVVVK